MIEWQWIDAEIDVDLLTIDPEYANVGAIPEDLIGLCVLQRKGDYCISRTDCGQWRFSILAENHQAHHLLIERYKNDQWRIRGLVHGTAPSIGEVLFNIRDPTIDYLSGILGTKVRFRKQINYNNMQHERFLKPQQVKNMHLMRKDEQYVYYKADVIYKGKQMVAALKTSRMPDDANWSTFKFDEIKVAMIAEKLSLPIHCPCAIYLHDRGYLVYEKCVGSTLDQYLLNYHSQLDAAARIRLCAAVCRVMAELHMANIFHGASGAANFFVRFSRGHHNRLRVRFDGANGLVPTSVPKLVQLEDFSRLAPEVAATRHLTTQSGVYSIGLLFEFIIDGAPLPDGEHSDPHAKRMSDVRKIVKQCKQRCPSARLTMDGAFIKLRDITQSLPTVPEPNWVFL